MNSRIHECTSFCVDVSQCSQWRIAEAAATKTQTEHTHARAIGLANGWPRMDATLWCAWPQQRAGWPLGLQASNFDDGCKAQRGNACNVHCTRSGRPAHVPLMAARLASTRCTAERNREHVWDADKMSRGEKRCATTSSTMMSRDSASAHTALPTPSASPLPDDDVGASRLDVWTSSSCIGAAPPSCASSHAVGGWPSDAIVELMIVSSPQRGTVMPEGGRRKLR
jgi:hypothetical protein